MKLRLRLNLPFFLALSGILLVAIACSTKKNTFTRRVYHNLTTHYNIYWNGNESFKNGLADLRKNARDNYNKILLVNNYGSAEDSRKIYSQLDRAIEKSTIAIQRHSLFFKKMEYNRWIDDCYLLIGKAQFYKQDYPAARRTFEFVEKQYPDNPIQYEAFLWQIKTNIQQKRWEEAVAQLEQFESKMSQDKVPFSVRREIPLVYADYFILNNNLKVAKTYLEQGLTLTTDRELKARIYYILAQINQQEKNFPKATQFYTKVIKGAASFEMAFNARINMAKSFDINSGDKAGLEKQLRKMSKDAKNKEFRDQIYFALSELAQLDKNDTLVMHYLKLSVMNSVSNDYQKTTSALQLANMCFDRLDYENAKAYYDTTMQVLPKDYPDFEALNNRTQMLTDLITNLQVVQYEDSLQKLGRMPEAELTALIKKLVDEYNRKEQLKKEEEQRQQMELAMATNVPNMRNERLQDLGGGGWYFNNPSAISLGYSEFMRKWGRRKLEDNWRLSNKRVVSNFGDEAENGLKAPGDSVAPADKKGLAAINLKDPKSYLQQIPIQPEDVAASNLKISEALLNLGYIYKDGLHDIPKSVQSFEELLKRFPDTKEALRIFYQLYLMGIDIPDEVMVSAYKAKILSGFPESDYAMIIENPDYNKEVLARKNRVSSLYEETYQAFSREQYRMVLLYCDQALSTYKDKDLLPKFEYLKALALGKTISTDTMVVLLANTIRTYPNSTITPMAKDLVAKYDKNAPVAAAANANASNQVTTAAGASNSTATTIFSATGDTAVPTIYKYSPGLTHFYIMMLNENNVNVSATKIRLSDFIIKNFNNDNLSVNAIILDAGWQMITISSFRNSQAALNFYAAVKQNDYVMTPLTEGDYKHFIISMENYPIFYREKKYDGYINFFNKYYPQ